MIDLTQILPLVQQLGPWGWVAAGVLYFLQWRAKQRPNAPAPDAPPAPAVPAVPDLADAALKLLLERLKTRFPRLVGDDQAGRESIVREYQQIRRQLLAERAAAVAKTAAIDDAVSGKATRDDEIPF